MTLRRDPVPYEGWACRRARLTLLPAGSALEAASLLAAAATPLSSSTITYDVAPVDGTDLAAVSLLANGTAPVAAVGTFVSTSLWAVSDAGTPVTPVLSTYDDGRTTPTDTTAPDVDAASAALVLPQAELSVSETVTAVSAGGGVATASVVQNGFAAAAVPEPTAVGWAVAAAVGCLYRRPVGPK